MCDFDLDSYIKDCFTRFRKIYDTATEEEKTQLKIPEQLNCFFDSCSDKEYLSSCVLFSYRDACHKYDKEVVHRCFYRGLSYVNIDYDEKQEIWTIVTLNACSFLIFLTTLLKFTR